MIRRCYKIKPQEPTKYYMDITIKRIGKEKSITVVRDTMIVTKKGLLGELSKIIKGFM